MRFKARLMSMPSGTIFLWNADAVFDCLAKAFFELGQNRPKPPERRHRGLNLEVVAHSLSWKHAFISVLVSKIRSVFLTEEWAWSIWNVSSGDGQKTSSSHFHTRILTEGIFSLYLYPFIKPWLWSPWSRKSFLLEWMKGSCINRKDSKKGTNNSAYVVLSKSGYDKTGYSLSNNSALNSCIPNYQANALFRLSSPLPHVDLNNKLVQVQRATLKESIWTATGPFQDVINALPELRI